MEASGIAFGVFFIIVGIAVLLFQNNKKNKCTETTTATVVDLIRKKTSSSHRTFAPVFEYNVNGQTVRVTSSYSTRHIKHNIEDKVELKYNPNNVNEFYVPGYNSKGLGILFILAGLGVIGLMIYKSVAL